MENRKKFGEQIFLQIIEILDNRVWPVLYCCSVDWTKQEIYGNTFKKIKNGTPKYV